MKRREESRSSTITMPSPTDFHSAVISSPMSKVESGPGIAAATKISDKEKYAYVKNELQLVGILTAVILALLVISALLLH